MNVAERVAQAATARFVVRCLGRFQIENASGDQLRLRTRKARAVLATLALTGRPMSRDALADLLWSDRGPVQARSSLRQAIFELQHFDSGDAPILIVGRDDLAIDREHLVTDIELVRSAAGVGDWPRLLTLLKGSGPGLLTDLDGLDAEFDDWLRLHRAQEPARTLATAVSAAERCLAEAGPRAALDLVSDILRLDPVNEEATRLALRIDHECGDSRALHHHFGALSERLRDEYDAEPSAETVALFKHLSNGAPRARATPEPGSVAAEFAPKSQSWASVLVPIAVLLVAAVALAALAWRNIAPPAPKDEPILLAVLPFEQQSAGDRFLAEGLWDDTRAAISRNGGLRVLGRATTRAVVGKQLAPREYDRRFGVDYLLEGSVRRSGEQVLVSVALTRTSDGVAVWEDSFRSRLGDPIALQEAIARGIEGRLRGRLAEGGGRRADQIATTPEVYALYNEARPLIRERWHSSARRAVGLLRKAVALDPNYAPAWAALAEAVHFSDWHAAGAEARRAEALGHARHALELAPRLAHAHAIEGFLLGDASPRAERSLRLAVELDPNHVEAWNWLGNMSARRFRLAEAAAAYRQATEIDPLWGPSAQNFADMLSQLGRQGELRQFVTSLRRGGGEEELILSVIANERAVRGDYSSAIAPILELKRRHPDRVLKSAKFDAGLILIALGYFDEAARIWASPDWFAPALRSERIPPMELDGQPVGPRDFWMHREYAAYSSRAMVNLGRERDLIDIYRRAYASREELESDFARNGELRSAIPTLAVALRTTGAVEEADQILAAAAKPYEQAMRYAGDQKYFLGDLAILRAASGRRAEALDLLARAVGKGWLPDGRAVALDIAQEPAFRELRGDPRFEAARKRILDHVSRERAELGPVGI